MTARDLRALAALTVVLVRRLLREGLVLRSLIWPPALAAGTLLITLAVASMVRVSAEVAIGPQVGPELAAKIADGGWVVTPVADPAATVAAGAAWAGTDGRTLWIGSGDDGAVRLEALLRAEAGSRWHPVARERLPGTSEAASQGARIVQVLMLLCTLYGVVFGLGMVARDRDDGTLESELSLPIGRWVPGAARWIAGTALLALFLGYCVATFDALVGVPDALVLARHGLAAAGGSVTIGIAMVGDAGTRRGFSGPLAAGLTAGTGLLGLGAASPGIGQWLPLASILAGGDGWVPVAVALGSGVAAAVVFAVRSARA